MRMIVATYKNEYEQFQVKQMYWTDEQRKGAESAIRQMWGSFDASISALSGRSKKKIALVRNQKVFRKKNSNGSTVVLKALKVIQTLLTFLELKKDISLLGGGKE